MRHVKRGHALIDCILVVGCVSVLAGLAMPVLLQMRASSRLDTCQIKIRRICLAAHNFHDSSGRLPPATLGYRQQVDHEQWVSDDSEQSWKRMQNSSSLLLMTPYMNLRNIFDSVDRIAVNLESSLHEYNEEQSGDFSWQGKITGMDVILPIMGSDVEELNRFLCPADDLPDHQDIQTIIATQATTVFEKSRMESNDQCLDIAVQYWPNEDDTLFPTNYLAVTGATGSTWGDDIELNRWQGAMTFRNRNRLQDLRDGTSRTLMYGESLGEIFNGQRNSAMSWMWGGAGRITGNQPFELDADFDAEETPLFGTAETSSGVGFGSKHDGTVVFALCDGSVRNISNTIDRTTLLQLAGTSDGGVPQGF